VSRRAAPLSNRSVPAIPINRAIKGLRAAAAVVMSQVEQVERLSIARSPHPFAKLSVKRRDPIETGSRRGRAGLIPNPWFQIDDEGGQEYLSVSEDFRLSDRIVDFPHLRKTVHDRP